MLFISSCLFVRKSKYNKGDYKREREREQIYLQTYVQETTCLVYRRHTKSMCCLEEWSLDNGLDSLYQSLKSSDGHQDKMQYQLPLSLDSEMLKKISKGSKMSYLNLSSPPPLQLYSKHSSGEVEVRRQVGFLLSKTRDFGSIFPTSNFKS